MNKVVFLQNSVEGPALSKGGAFHIAAWENGFIDLEVTNSLFTQNYSQQRGGAVNAEQNIKSYYANNIFAGNKSKDGGAIFDNSSNEEIVHINNTFYRNFADETGGAIVNFGDYNADNQIESTNCIFFQNTTRNSSGPGFNNFGDVNNNFSFQNCLFSENDLAIIESEAVATVDRGANQFAANPFFVDPDNSEFSLESRSPAKDAGDGSFVSLKEDFSGKVRIQDAEVDLGAIEFGDEVSCNFDNSEFNNASVNYKEADRVSRASTLKNSQQLENSNLIKDHFLVFPNPIESSVIVKANHNLGPAKIQLFDIRGALILSDVINTSEKRINTEALSAGVYLIRIQGADFFQTVKVVKN